MSAYCVNCGATASKGEELGHKTSCPIHKREIQRAEETMFGSQKPIPTSLLKMVTDKKMNSVIIEIAEEYTKAIKDFDEFRSDHEGFAVLLEEVDELWDSIKAGGNPERRRAEAVQVAAMALRFIIDCCSD